MPRLNRLLVLSLLLLAFPTTLRANSATVEPFAPEGVAALVAYSPDGRLAVGSPDHGGRELCIYAVPSAEVVSCVDLSDRFVRFDFYDVAWSPDSSRIAFSHRALTLLDDGDIWIMDTATGELTNVTDDGFEGRLLGEQAQTFEGRIYVDVLPRWSPDGRSLAFSRTIWSAVSELRPTELWVLDVETGESRRVAAVAGEPGALLFGLAWAPDGETIYATRFGRDPESRAHGIWAYDPVSGEAEQLLRQSTGSGTGSPAVLNVSPDGAYLSIYYPRLLSGTRSTMAIFALYDLARGEIIPLAIPAEIDPRGEALAVSLGFNPDGETVLFAVSQPESPHGAVVLQHLESGESEVIALLPEGERPFPYSYAEGIRFGANGLALVPVVSGAGYLIGAPDPTRRALTMEEE